MHINFLLMNDTSRLIPKCQTPVFTVDDLVECAQLARMWDFGDVRRAAMKKILELPVSPFHGLIIGRKLRSSRWIIDAYVKICKHDALPCRDEAQEIGWEAWYEIVKLRETQMRKVSSSSGEWDTKDLELAIEKIFRHELVEDERYSPSGTPNGIIFLVLTIICFRMADFPNLQHNQW